METFTLTRKEMATMLLALQGRCPHKPLSVLQEAWMKNHRSDVQKGTPLSAFLSTQLPAVFEKMMKQEQLPGFSLQEIVSLANQIEYTHCSITSVQNWVKRDFKDFFGSPKAGKKYSLDQCALIFIIEDLKNNLDFESIRKLFQIIFRQPDNDADDLINPVDLYYAYSISFEELDANNDQLMDVEGHESGRRNHDILTETTIRRKADVYAGSLPGLDVHQREAVRNMLFIAMVSVQTAYFHSLARRYFNAALFLQHLAQQPAE